MKPFKSTLMGAAAAALVLTTTTALAGSGVGGVFNLGQVNTVDAQTSLNGNPGGNPLLKVTSSGTAAAVRGVANTGIGTNGVSTSGVGQQGLSNSGIGTLGTHGNTTGINPGVQGETNSTDPAGAGVVGKNNGGGPGLKAVVNPGAPPLAVNSQIKVANLNADLLDGLDSPALQKRVTGTCGAGSAVKSVNVDGTVTCEPVGGGGVWSLNGNSGTSPGTNFLGTSDNQALELKVNGQRALRIEPTADTPNLVGGSAVNTVGPGVIGAVIGGGGGGSIGTGNNVTGGLGTVGGGWQNQAGGSATVAGGQANVAAGDYSAIGGGFGNGSSAGSATVGGGNSNSADGQTSVVGGGSSNHANSLNSTVGGGSSNTAAGDSSTVAGGQGNLASGYDSTVAGGFSNTAGGDLSTVVGGGNNSASGYNSLVGGSTNEASGRYAAVFGLANTAGGWYSAVPGGSGNSAAGDYSFAAGARAKANHQGTFVWADLQAADMASTGPDQFIARALGHFFLQSDSSLDDQGGFINTSTGAFLSTGGTWTNASDRAKKRNFRSLDKRDVLEKVVRMPITSWSYKAEKPAIRHIGPMAQDFYKAFGLGLDDKHITTIDEGGVALAAIQGLYRKNQELERRVRLLEHQLQIREGRRGR